MMSKVDVNGARGELLSNSGASQVVALGPCLQLTVVIPMVQRTQYTST